MKSEAGSTITKIAGIINLIFAILVALFSVIGILGATFYMGFNFRVLLLFSFLSLIMFLVSFLVLDASKKMKNKKTVREGAIMAIIIGVLTLQFLTGVLTFIGGIIALKDSDKK